MSKETIQTDTKNVFAIILVPLVFIFHNINFYKSLLIQKDCFLLFGLWMVLPIILYTILRALTKFSRNTAVSFCLSITIFFFFFGAIQDTLLQNKFLPLLGKSYVIVFLFLLALLFIGRFKKDTYARYLKLLFLLLLLFEVGQLLIKRKSFNEIPLKSEISLNATYPDSSLNIYHLVFDSYTNSKTLKKYFAFDNPIDTFLQNQGFRTISGFKSNYNFTPYSIASTLNMQYFNISKDLLEGTSKNFFIGKALYTNNIVFDYFKSLGYKINQYSLLDGEEHLTKLGTFAPKKPAFLLRKQTLERLYLNPWLINKAINFGKNSDVLPPAIVNNIEYYISYNDRAYHHLMNLSISHKPSYSFTHFLVPHEPYVFSEFGIDSTQLKHYTPEDYRYIDQVKYANSLIIKLVKELKEGNKKNIIIIQGDHGFRNYGNQVKKSEEFEAFCSIYLPDRNYQHFSDSTSSVNIYRLILNKYFAQDLKLVTDSICIEN